ncbi:MAG TPA: hypothetical protein DCY24_03605 [Rikenellaceae bacterium]|nr:hypothetical protein [Rikenellaceae bacterium]
MTKALAIALLLGLAICGCRKEDTIVPPTYGPLGFQTDPDADPVGMYVLNEGNMGSNKADIDFLDYRTASYACGIYAEKNPTVVKGLGDTGNDLQIYDGRLFAVINGSHKVEVMDAYTAKRIAQIDIANCRYIAFKDNYAYVTAYVGSDAEFQADRKGSVFKVNLDTYKIEGEAQVGYQPEEIVIIGSNAYVANSGGYRAPNYDSTVSVIDINSMKELYKIDVAINLCHIKADSKDNLWVSSNGNYVDVASNLYRLENDGTQYKVAEAMNIPVSNMAIANDSIYIYSSEYSYVTSSSTITYAIVDANRNSIVSRKFISDGTESQIVAPYGIAVHPYNGDIYITDAKNYTSSGTLYCYSKSGVLKWSATTGDIPGHFAFLPRER